MHHVQTRRKAGVRHPAVMARVMWRACTPTIAACLVVPTKTGCHQKVSISVTHQSNAGILNAISAIVVLWCWGICMIAAVPRSLWRALLLSGVRRVAAVLVIFCTGSWFCFLTVCLVCCVDEVWNESLVMNAALGRMVRSCQLWTCSACCSYTDWQWWTDFQAIFLIVKWITGWVACSFTACHCMHAWMTKVKGLIFHEFAHLFFTFNSHAFFFKGNLKMLTDLDNTESASVIHGISPIHLFVSLAQLNSVEWKGILISVSHRSREVAIIISLEWKMSFPFREFRPAIQSRSPRANSSCLHFSLTAVWKSSYDLLWPKRQSN